MILSRRASIVMLGGAAAGGLTRVSDAASQKLGDFDPNEPEDNLIGFVKVMGDTSGKPVWMVGGGRIYGLRDGEMPLPLFGVQGLRYLKFVPEGDSFRMHVRDWAYFTDIETGDLLERYRNPYTREDNTATPLLTRFFSWTMGPNGQQFDNFTGKAWLHDKPLKMPWSFTGENASVTLELLVEYGNGGFGGEWVNMHTETSALFDESVSQAPMHYSWTGYSPWARWMNMGARPGRTLWNSNGQKTADLESLPTPVRANFDRLFPGSLDNPETYEKVSGLTSTTEE